MGRQREVFELVLPTSHYTHFIGHLHIHAKWKLIGFLIFVSRNGDTPFPDAVACHCRLEERHLIWFLSFSFRRKFPGVRIYRYWEMSLFVYISYYFLIKNRKVSIKYWRFMSEDKLSFHYFIKKQQYLIKFVKATTEKAKTQVMSQREERKLKNNFKLSILQWAECRRVIINCVTSLSIHIISWMFKGWVRFFMWTYDLKWHHQHVT